MKDDLLVFNGINAVTGGYLIPPLGPSAFARIIEREPSNDKHWGWWKTRPRRYEEVDLGPKEGVNPKDLAQSGWGIIFAHDADPKIREALDELLVHRRTQATAENKSYYRECVGLSGYRRRESKLDFLARHGAGPGAVDPQHFPYYLLIVGSPESIPFDFQFELDIQYAVGRIWFNTLDEYRQYAHTVVAAETSGLALPRRAAFWGPKHENDDATALSADHLVKPLADWIKNDQPAWTVETFVGGAATKARLTKLLGGSDSPAILFTASHGIGFERDDTRQSRYQGALLCQDWPGVGQCQRPMPADFYFSGDDVVDDATFHGMISFHFACYGGGTPRFNDFPGQRRWWRRAIAPKAFLAYLPQRLLSNPQGGVLAVVGHVERAWGYSIAWPGAGRQLATFEGTLKRLLDGYPVGHALGYFNERWPELEIDLARTRRSVRRGNPDDDKKLCDVWRATKDARNYIVIGDPAVRVPVNKPV